MIDCDLRLEQERKCFNDFGYVWLSEVGGLVWRGGNALRSH